MDLSLRIGHSLGWFAAKVSPDIKVIERLIETSGIDVFELTCGDPERTHSLLTGSDKLSHLPRLVTVNLPNQNLQPSSLHFENVDFESMQKWASICKLHRAKHAVIHPDGISNVHIAMLKSLGIPVGIENMGRSHKSGSSPKDLVALCKKLQVPLVLDLQHAYEHSIDLYGHSELTKFVSQFIFETLNGVKISYLHVSGEITWNGTQVVSHASLLDATNRESIFGALDHIKSFFHGSLPPIILEGDYLPEESCGIKTAKQQNDLISLAAERMRKEKELIVNRLSASHATRFPFAA